MSLIDVKFYFKLFLCLFLICLFQDFIACGNAVEAIFLSYLLYCIFEAPYVNVCKLVFMPSINRHSHNGKDVNENTLELNKSKNSNDSNI
jgi:hypothetical protein